MPRVSIGLPVYNGARYLPDALSSLENQTFKDFEVLISDNASTDGTEALCREVASRDPRFRYLRQRENLGASRNYNITFERSHGEYFKWLAHDDMCRPDHLEKLVQVLDASPSAVLAYSGTVLIEASGKVIEEFHDVDDDGTSPSRVERLTRLLGGEHSRSILNMCFPVFGLIRSADLRATGLIRNTPRSDVVLLVELSLRGPFAAEASPSFLRRTHLESSVETASRDATPEEMEKRLAAWYDPKRGKRYPMTRTWLALGFLRAVLSTPMPPLERLRCLGVLKAWFGKNWRVIAGDAKRGVYDRLGVSR